MTDSATKKKLFGIKLKILRNKKQFSQEYCIRKVVCDMKSWYRWEQGISYPHPIYRPKIQHLFPELGKL